MTQINLIEEYQCPGCMHGSNTRDCSKFDNQDNGCRGHYAGTLMMPVGSIFLGMPRGFNRVGRVDKEAFPLQVFDGWESFTQYFHGFDKFNIPVWKHLDQNGNTLIRGISPRINAPFIFVIQGDHRDKVNCLEIMEADIEEMD